VGCEWSTSGSASAPDSGGVPSGTALDHAAVFSMTEVVDVLVAAGARIHTLEMAAAAGDISGWPLGRFTLQSRVRALVFAADHQRLEVIDQLIEAGTPVDEADAAWGRLPRRAWAPGPHQLIVNPVLEDLAGNSVSRVFDWDLTRPADQPRCRPPEPPLPGSSGCLLRTPSHSAGTAVPAGQEEHSALMPIPLAALGACPAGSSAGAPDPRREAQSMRRPGSSCCRGGACTPPGTSPM
jgi:hypothetical protein